MASSTRIALVAAILTSTSIAHADGELSMRGFYYKESATRVVQPMVDAELDAGENGTVEAHMLVDAITSASVASGAAATAFTERRYEVGGSYIHELDVITVTGFARYSTEPDYKSVFGGVSGVLSLARDNATVGLALARGSDDITNDGAQTGMGDPIEGSLSTSMGSVSFSQVLSPQVIAAATYDLVYLDGFQENAYRTVVAGGVIGPERVPDTRLRHAMYGSVRAHVPTSSTTIIAGYRFYIDDWGIKAHTPEVRVVQEVGDDIVVHGRFRYYRQTAADFFKTIYDSNDPDVEPFLTDDIKLSGFTGRTVGVKVDTSLGALGIRGDLARVRADVVLEHVTQNNRFGNAIVGMFGVTVPFEY